MPSQATKLLFRNGILLRAILIATLLVAGTAIMMALAGWEVVKGFEGATARASLQHGESAFNRFTTEAGESGQTLAAWLSQDPSVKAAVSGRPSGELETLTRMSLATERADFIAIVDRTGRVQVLPKELSSAVQAADFGVRLSANDSNEGSVSGFVRGSDGSLQWRAVSLVGESSSPSGRVVVGYVLGEAFAERFKTMSGIDLIIYSQGQLLGTSLPDELTSSAAGTNIAAEGSADGTFRALQLGVRNYRVRYFPIADVLGQPVGMYGLAVPATLLREEVGTLLSELIPFVLKIIGIAVIATYIMTKGVIRPLRALTGAVSRMGQGDLSTPVEISLENEMGSLATELEEMRRKLRQALNDLAIEKSLYQGIFHSMADGVFTTDTSGKITSANPAAAALFQLESATLLEQDCCGGFSLEDSAGRPLCDRVCLQRYMDPELTPALTKARVRSSGQEIVDVEVNVAPVRDESGSSVGLVHVMRDISAQEELQRLKNRFLLSVAHELRTPLSSLSASIDILREDLPTMKPQDRDQMLATVQRGALRLQNLVSNLLDLGSIEAGRFVVELQPMDLAVTLQEVASMCEPILAAKGQKVDLALPDGLPKVHADGRRVSQILMNLLTNCSKYAPEGDTVRVEVWDVSGSVCVSVSDHGPGIPPEAAPHLFEYYYRGNNEKTEAGQGFGLGLAISKGIVEAHGGEVGVETQLGKGTTIWFSLPLPPGSLAQGRSAMSPSSAQA